MPCRIRMFPASLDQRPAYSTLFAALLSFCSTLWRRTFVSLARDPEQPCCLYATEATLDVPFPGIMVDVWPPLYRYVVLRVL
ncbi:uncharacterized protein TrAtP1_009201 [Trichoderma atroviride]|uniref:uncharacterized protein n=1 Tax=Hypocrea atroviridis TaxID=63577 RepID=UPI00332E944F|nr:hypothetical protein TrAtP1_009201 [Trichoderma atroviride]